MLGNKLRSLNLLAKNELPVLPYVILKPNRFKEQIKAFCLKNKIKKFMVRTDGKGNFSPSINNALLDLKTVESIHNFFAEDYLVFIMKPGNIFRNYHSINIMLEKDGVLLEVVGPGFIATDLNRGGLLHETIKLDKQTNEVSEYTVFPGRYLSDRRERITSGDLRILKKNKSYLLKYKEYSKLDVGELNYIKKCIPKLRKCSRLGSVASMSFVNLKGNKNTPIFWDMAILG